MLKKILAVCLVTLSLAGCGAPKEQVLQGSMEGQTFTIPDAQMSITLPEEFEIFTGKDLDSQIGRGASAIYRLAARRTETMQVVTVFVVQGKESALAYMQEASEKMAEDREMLSDVVPMEINGFRFESLHSRSTMEDGQKVDEITLACDMSGAVLGISNVYLPEHEDTVQEDLQKMIAKVESTPAQSTVQEDASASEE